MHTLCACKTVTLLLHLTATLILTASYMCQKECLSQTHGNYKSTVLLCFAQPIHVGLLFTTINIMEYISKPEIAPNVLKKKVKIQNFLGVDALRPSYIVTCRREPPSPKPNCIPYSRKCSRELNFTVFTEQT